MKSTLLKDSTQNILYLQNGKILVHGIEGLNRSAAVVIAYLMSSATCILEEAQFYLRVLRPHLQVMLALFIAIRTFLFFFLV